MVASLFEHETISTTIQKAKEVKSFAEKLITLAKKGSLHDRRRAISLLGNRALLVEEDGSMVKKGTVVGKLFSEIGPRYLDRAGGYTRIIRLAKRRLGDNGEVVLFQLVGQDDQRGKKSKVRKAVHAAPAAEADAAPAEPTEASPATESAGEDDSQE